MNNICMHYHTGMSFLQREKQDFAPGCSFSLLPSSVLTMSSWIWEETGHQTWCASETFVLEFLPCGQRAKHGVEWDWPRRLRVCEETGCGKCKSSKARFRYRYLILSDDIVYNVYNCNMSICIKWSKVAYSSAANSWAQGHRLTRSNWRCRWGKASMSSWLMSCRASMLVSHEESLLQPGFLNLEPIFEAKRHGQALFCDEPGKRFASPSPENTERHDLRCVWCIWITFCIFPMWQHV